MKQEAKRGNFISKSDKKDLQTRKIKMEAHQWMQSELQKLTYQDVVANNGILNEFKNNHISTIFKMIEEKKTEEEIENFLALEFAKFYHKKSIKKSQK